jgi:hypothetical protein
MVMNGPTSALTPWSALSEDEQTRLQSAYQEVLDCESGTCSFEIKLDRMQRWLAERGVSITEGEIRRPRR